MRLQMSFWVHCSNTVPDFIHATALTSPGKPLISIKQPTNTFCTTISTINYIQSWILLQMFAYYVYFAVRNDQAFDVCISKLCFASLSLSSKIDTHMQMHLTSEDRKRKSFLPFLYFPSGVTLNHQFSCELRWIIREKGRHLTAAIQSEKGTRR